MARLTVLVPVYNSEKYLAATLDSLVNQTYTELKILAINDGSTDRSQQILEEYAQKYPQIEVIQKTNTGIAATRNFGVERVDTEYFGFLDSDDTTSADMFEKMIKKADETQADVVVSHFNWTYVDHQQKQTEGPYTAGKEMVVHLFATLWNKVYRTEVIRKSKVTFPDGNRYEDAYFLYCIAPLIQKVAFVDEAFVNYYQRPGSITHNNNQDVQNMIRVFKLIQRHYQERGLFECYHDELEYIHVKFFLGNSFLRSVQIEDRTLRKETVMMGWNLLNESFPDWHKNPYLRSMPGLKHKYYRMVNRVTLPIFSQIFHVVQKLRQQF